jgi:hypothetical protein
LWPKLRRKWLTLDWGQRLMLLEAAWSLVIAQAAVRLLPFRWITPRLGRLAQPAAAPQQAPPLSPAQAHEAQQVGWAVRAPARYLPWDARCLAQAIAAKWMLQRRGLPSTLYLGVDRGQEKWLEAHAWLRCGDEILTGEPEHARFKVIAAFTEDSP